MPIFFSPICIILNVFGYRFIIIFVFLFLRWFRWPNCSNSFFLFLLLLLAVLNKVIIDINYDQIVATIIQIVFIDLGAVVSHLIFLFSILIFSYNYLDLVWRILLLLLLLRLFILYTFRWTLLNWRCFFRPLIDLFFGVWVFTTKLFLLLLLLAVSCTHSYSALGDSRRLFSRGWHKLISAWHRCSASLWRYDTFSIKVVFKLCFVCVCLTATDLFG